MLPRLVAAAILFAVGLGIVSGHAQFGPAVYTAQPSGAFSTWSSTDKSSVTVSGGGLTATTVAPNGNPFNSSFVRGTAACSGTRFYFEGTLTWGSGSPTVPVFGIANSSYTVSQNVAGYDTGANAATATMTTTAIEIGNVGVGSWDGLNTGNTIGIAVDTISNKIWAWSSVTTHYNGDVIGNQNPAVGSQVGGASLSTLHAGPYMPVWGSQSNGDVMVLNVGASAFVNTLPTGFSACH